MCSSLINKCVNIQRMKSYLFYIEHINTIKHLRNLKEISVSMNSLDIINIKTIKNMFPILDTVCIRILGCLCPIYYSFGKLHLDNYNDNVISIFKPRELTIVDHYCTSTSSKVETKELHPYVKNARILQNKFSIQNFLNKCPSITDLCICHCHLKDMYYVLPLITKLSIEEFDGTDIFSDIDKLFPNLRELILLPLEKYDITAGERKYKVTIKE